MDLKEYMRRFEKATTSFDSFCLQYLDKKTTSIVNQAKKRTPVKTGALRASWRGNKAVKAGKTYKSKIMNGQSYASFIEFGTSRGIKPYNMVTVPVQSFQRNVQKDFEKAVADHFRKEGIY